MRQSKRSLFFGLVIAAALSILLSGCQLVQGASWQSLHLEQGGVILSLATDPFNSQLIYVGASNGLVYAAHADKSSGFVASSGLPHDAPVVALVADPLKKGLIYAGTSAGFYASTDYSATWQVRGTGLPRGDSIVALACAKDQGILFAGTLAHGVFSSHDQGNTWQTANSGLPTNADVNALFWEPTTQMLYVAISDVGVFASTDHGATWTERSAGLPKTVSSLVALTANGINVKGLTLYAGTDHGVYASTDSGMSWSVTGQGFTQAVYSLATYPPIEGWIYAGTETDVIRSPDGGRTWSTIAPGIGHRVDAIVSVPSTASPYIIFAASEGLRRFPPESGNSGSNILSLIFEGLILAGLLGGLLYFTRRARRTWNPPAPPTPANGSDNTRTPSSPVATPEGRAKMSPQLRTFTETAAQNGHQSASSTSTAQGSTSSRNNNKGNKPNNGHNNGGPGNTGRRQR